LSDRSLTVYRRTYTSPWAQAATARAAAAAARGDGMEDPYYDDAKGKKRMHPGGAVPNKRLRTSAVGLGMCCSPRYMMPCNSITRVQSASADEAGNIRSWKPSYPLAPRRHWQLT
jgi:hypothetical protein